jgi:starch synthase (maltosyl-transferring)
MHLDGTIAYAENPPKKYHDVFPLNFDNDPEGIYQGIRDVVEVWIDAGVTAFRVDNPHTKPLPFWERLLKDVRLTHPEVIFLSEAFTIPPMMHTLAKIGFHQSYTYFTWRTTVEEVGNYLEEVSGDASYYMRPNFWPTTHDILTPDMQAGGVPLFAARAVVAATGSPSWGIYSGYEFAENVARPGVEEQIDNEKYEFRPRQWSKANKVGIAPLLTQLNLIRRNHPALQRLRGLAVHRSENTNILCFSRHIDAAESPTGEADTIIVVVNLDPLAPQVSTIHLDPRFLGLNDAKRVPVVDLLTGAEYAWGPMCYVELGPSTQMAHVAWIRRGARGGAKRG